MNIVCDYCLLNATLDPNLPVWPTIRPGNGVILFSKITFDCFVKCDVIQLNFDEWSFFDNSYDVLNITCWHTNHAPSLYT